MGILLNLTKEYFGELMRKEEETDFDIYFKNIEWVDMGHPKYLFADTDFKYDTTRKEYDYRECLSTISEFIYVIKKLKIGVDKKYRLMKREDMLWLLENNKFKFVDTKIKGISYGEKIVVENNGKKVEINTFSPKGCEVKIMTGISNQSNIFKDIESDFYKVLFFKFRNSVEEKSTPSGGTISDLRKKEGSIHQMEMHGKVTRYSIRFKLMKKK